MRAVVLAAGLGTRLRPLTDTTPKCLIDVGRTTPLDFWLDRLHRCGVDDVLVNTHHLANQVHAHISARQHRPPRVTVAYEPELLGSAGTLKANAEFLGRDDTFLAVYSDNLTTFDLSLLINAHRASNTRATITVFRTSQPSRCGIVEVDGELMVGFEEKPSNPRSDLANAGMYAFSRATLSKIAGDPPLDIGFDLLPTLIGQARVVSIGDAYFTDIGTAEALRQARERWRGWSS